MPKVSLKDEPMTNIQSFNGSAVEWVEEGGEDVLLLGGVLLLLLEGERVEQKVGGECHYQVLLGAQAERPGAKNVYNEMIFDLVHLGIKSLY